MSSPSLFSLSEVSVTPELEGAVEALSSLPVLLSYSFYITEAKAEDAWLQENWLIGGDVGI